MKTKFQIKTILTFLLFLLVSAAAYPQSSGDTQKKNELEAQIKTARLSGDAVTAHELQMELGRLNHEKVVQAVIDESFTFIPASKQNPPFNGEGDYIVSQIDNLNSWSRATASEAPNFPNYGRTWVASTEFRNGGPDTIKFYYTTNRGASWVYYGKLFTNVNSDFRPDELDIELVYSGTETYIFGTAAYTDFTNGNKIKCICFRIGTTTPLSMVVQINNPAFSDPWYHLYNPRITSDNTNYTSTTYLMMTYSGYTDCNGSIANFDTYYMYADFIFGIPTIHYVDYIGTAGCPLPSAPEHYIYSDVGYCNNAGHEQTMVLFHINAGASYNYTKVGRYFGYNSYQTTSIINETAENYGQRIAFTGSASDAHGIITYIRRFSATDWDLYCQRTTDGISWSPQVIDASTKRARWADVISQRNFVDVFKVAYIEDNPTAPACFYTGCSGSSWSVPAGTVANTMSIDTTYCKVRAGYVTGIIDNCLAIYANSSTYYGYASRLCQTTTGVENANTNPQKFSLEQNYPNPFNPSTEIKYSLSGNSNVKLTVFDALGKEVTVLASGVQKAGNYSVNFDASAFATGVYFYKLETEGFTDTKKMLMVK